MDTNLFEDFQEKIESQLKQAETDLKKEKASVLFGIECTMEGAVDKTELASLNRQYDVAEKQFEREMLNQKNRIIDEHMAAMKKLMKHLRKIYTKRKPVQYQNIYFDDFFANKESYEQTDEAD